MTIEAIDEILKERIEPPLSPVQSSIIGPCNLKLGLSVVSIIRSGEYSKEVDMLFWVLNAQ